MVENRETHHVELWIGRLHMGRSARDMAFLHIQGG
jgi:hypothetical protein